MILALFARWGFSGPWAKLVAYVVLPIALLALLWLLLDAWGDSRYRAGVSDEHAAWQKASSDLIVNMAASANVADVKEAARLSEHENKVAEEKARVDEAVAENRSALDALFPVSVR